MSLSNSPIAVSTRFLLSIFPTFSLYSSLYLSLTLSLSSLSLTLHFSTSSLFPLSLSSISFSLFFSLRFFTECIYLISLLTICPDFSYLTYSFIERILPQT